MKHPVKHFRFPKAAVETVAKFRQIAGQMFGTDAMVDTPDIAFDIGDQGVDPGQDLRCLLPRAGYQPLMTETGRSVQEALALPAICFDHCLGRQPLPYQRLNLFAADSGHQPHGGKPGIACINLIFMESSLPCWFNWNAITQKGRRPWLNYLKGLPSTA